MSKKSTVPRKPDRFERLVRKLPTDREGGLYEDDVVNLLRQEHEWMSNMVNDQMKGVHTKTGWWDGYRGACLDILTRLTQRRKG